MRRRRPLLTVGHVKTPANAVTEVAAVSVAQVRAD
jgi:hypothetical protein